MPSNDTECGRCKHPYLDHGGWMSEEQRKAVEKHRQIGCRVIGCGCETFYVGWSASIDSDMYLQESSIVWDLIVWKETT